MLVYAEFFPRLVGFEYAAVYAAHNPEWHGVMEFVLVGAVGNVLMVHFYRAEL